MTKTHLIAMAAITASISNPDTRKFVASEQADYFASINPLFDRTVYMKACGL
jgi:hypothetical protein